MTSNEVIEAIERLVASGEMTLRAALVNAWRYGCTHGGGSPWPEFDVRRVGDRWCVVRVIDGSVMTTWATQSEAHEAYLRQVCTPDIPGPRSSYPPPR